MSAGNCQKQKRQKKKQLKLYSREICVSAGQIGNCLQKKIKMCSAAVTRRQLFHWLSDFESESGPLKSEWR